MHYVLSKTVTCKIYKTLYTFFLNIVLLTFNRHLVSETEHNMTSIDLYFH